MNLLDKSEGVKDCVKFIENRLKEINKEIEARDYYDDPLINVRSELVNIKISLEKYSKKLKHQYKEESSCENW